MELSFPITQIALDYPTTAEALEMAATAVEAGFDCWRSARPSSPARVSLPSANWFAPSLRCP